MNHSDSVEETPKLLLFLSVDFLHATRFKSLSRQSEGVHDWLLIFKNFYTRFPEYLTRNYPHQVPPRVWKCLGDELVFVQKLTSSAAALDYIRAFRKSVREYNGDFKKKQLDLRLKATAWVAGFPVSNAEVEVPNYFSSNGKCIDYIGPSIDVGFRLTKYSSVRQFVVSVELALLLLNKTHELKFYFDSPQELKGVLDGKPYPIIWIDMLDDGERSVEEDLRGSMPNTHALQQYCEEFIRQANGNLIRPFIEGDYDFNLKPADWDKRYAKARSLLDAECEPESAMDESDAGTPNASDAILADVRKELESLRQLLNSGDGIRGS